MYLIIIEGALAYSLLSFANKGLPSSTVSMYACAQPLITSVLSFWLLGDAFNALQLFGGCLVVAGLHFTLRLKEAQAAQFNAAPASTGPSAGGATDGGFTHKYMAVAPVRSGGAPKPEV